MRMCHADVTGGTIVAAKVVPTPTVTDTSGRLTYRINELASMLGVSVKTLDRMRRAGEFPPPDQHAGRVLLWRVGTVESWLERSWNAKRSSTGSKAEHRVKAGT